MTVINAPLRKVCQDMGFSGRVDRADGIDDDGYPAIPLQEAVDSGANAIIGCDAVDDERRPLLVVLFDQ